MTMILYLIMGYIAWRVLKLFLWRVRMYYWRTGIRDPKARMDAEMQWARYKHARRKGR